MGFMVQLDNQASQPSLAANCLICVTYVHFWLQKKQDGDSQKANLRLQTAVHKPMGDVTDTTPTSIIITVYGTIANFFHNNGDLNGMVHR